MKIIDRPAFMAMPSGTVFAKYEPCFFDEICVKGDTLTRDDGKPIDWVYQNLVSPTFTTANDSGAWMEQLDRIEAGEASPPLDFDCMSRDGCFDDKQLFAVFEVADVDALVARLVEARAEGYSDSDTRPKAGDAKQAPLASSAGRRYRPPSLGHSISTGTRRD